MLHKVKSNKGFIEIASVFAIIGFIAIFILVLFSLGFTSSREKQEVSWKIGETNLVETLYVFLATETGEGNAADLVVDAVNSKDFDSLDKATKEFFKGVGFDWIVFIKASDKDLHSISNVDAYKDVSEENLEKTILAAGIIERVSEAEQTIPNPSAKDANVVVKLYKIPKPDDKGVEF